MTLRELLLEDGYSSTDNRGILVHDRGIDMAVSHRYLSGGWQEVLDSSAIRIRKGEYETCDKPQAKSSMLIVNGGNTDSI